MAIGHTSRSGIARILNIISPKFKVLQVSKTPIFNLEIMITKTPPCVISVKLKRGNRCKGVLLLIICFKLPNVAQMWDCSWGVEGQRRWVYEALVPQHSCVWLFVTAWTVAHQAPLSMEFSRQESWSGLPFSSPGDGDHREQASVHGADPRALRHMQIWSIDRKQS